MILTNKYINIKEISLYLETWHLYAYLDPPEGKKNVYIKPFFNINV